MYEVIGVEKLIFEDKMSGIRVNLSKELREEMNEITMGLDYMTPKDVPDFVLYGIWWSFKGMFLEILFEKDSTNVKLRKSGKTEEILVSEYYSKSLFDSLVGMLDNDDQIKVWLYTNRKDIWEQLVDKFGSEKNVFDEYIRFNH